ncbi:hypothetical protein EVAR_12726_1 [Eumeta japonica]|uniref:Uncharacterized protein n=1 Tax=Eumeta variegata TaxID=151549 RepID=A0A4C1UNC5_EUMVA|nr:hypothetical protein EVAR_12726_1 [Eumeta japonica]
MPNIKDDSEKNYGTSVGVASSDRTLHRTRHRLVTAFFARRSDAKVRPPVEASVGGLASIYSYSSMGLAKKSDGGDIYTTTRACALRGARCRPPVRKQLNTIETIKKRLGH